MVVYNYEFAMWFYSPVIENRGRLLVVRVTPEMKTIPFSFYLASNATYSVNVSNSDDKCNEQLKVSFPVFKFKVEPFERYKYIVDISIDSIRPLFKDGYYNALLLEIKDTTRDLVNSFYLYTFFGTDAPQYNYVFSRPSLLEGFILIIKLFTEEIINFKLFKKLLYLTCEIVRSSYIDDHWNQTVRLLKELLYQNEGAKEKIIKLKQICCNTTEKLSYVLQSLVLTAIDKEKYRKWKILFESYNLDDECIEIVRKKMEKEITEGNVEPCTNFRGNYDLELSFLTLKLPNISFRADPYYVIMLKDFL
ncbi:hypothetical protein ABK040_003152 [Willaertia magna]